jgi:lysophospholipase L1-like esterase
MTDSVRLEKGARTVRIKYILGSMVCLPFLPILYFQGKKVRLRTPKLPEAGGCSGSCARGSDTELKVIFIGESSIAGVGVDSHEEGFAGTFAKELANNLDANVHWEVYAKSGYTMKKIADEIVPGIPDESADLIVIGLGANDAFTLNNPWTWRWQAAKLIFDLKEKFGDVPIVFANMPPIKEFPAFTFLIKLIIGNLVEILGKELVPLMEQHNGVYYDSRKITVKEWKGKIEGVDDVTAFFSDGVHPSKLTYRLWAENLAQFVDAHVDIKRKLVK